MAKSTIDWMKMQMQMHDGKSYYDRWIHPMGGLNAGTTYEGRPVGNSPEMMPWDASLNKDVDDRVARGVACTKHLKPGDEGYELRYSRATPKLQSSAYLRVLDPVHGPNGGAPTSKRIIQDIDKFLPLCEEIRLANGTVVEGLGSRNGHRAAANAGVAKRGGKRVKRLEPPGGGWTDPAIAGIIERKLEHSVNLVTLV